MRVTPIDDRELIERLGKSEGERSTGLHLSDVYKALMKRLQPKRFDKRDAAGNPLPFDKRKIEIGLLFENMLEKGLAEKFATVRPGEIFSDEGIAMTPDGVNPTLMAGEEYKSTSMSCREGIFEIVEIDGVAYHIPHDKFLHYFIQMKGYAKWMDVRRFILTILFIYGDYKWHAVDDCWNTGPCRETPIGYTGKTPVCGGGSHPCGPVFKQYDITFTDDEIEQNWQMLMTVAREEGMLP